MASGGWLRGVVKEVQSGDSLTICGCVKPGAVPPEKRLTLSSLVAPKLGKRGAADEPLAWQSRELLRQKLVGQTVVFRVDYVVDSIAREFGSVFLGSSNVAEAMVAAGMAKVRTGGAQQSPHIEALRKAEEKAQLAGVGLWSKDSKALAETVRSVQSVEAFDATGYFQASGKGRQVAAVVEAVNNGGMLRASLLPEGQLATVVLCGVQAPSMGRRPAPAAAAAATPAALGDAATSGATAGSSAASVAGTSSPDPFAPEAKALTERRALNRDVTLVLEGVDKYNNLFASVLLPPLPEPPAAANGAANGAAAAAADAKKESLAELLVKAGYAKCVEWSLSLMSSGAQELKNLEKAAKQQRVGIWANYVAPPTNQTKLSDSFTGKVIEVVSGDCLVIKDAASGVERRVQLSSLRAPRMGTRDRAADPYGAEAREFLRKRLIGREVEVKMEYTRKVAPLGGGEEREMAFGNVAVVPEKGEERQNVGEVVVARGFASVIRHREEEERSCIYPRLTEVEALARNAKRGVHSGKEPAANRINDISAPNNAAKAKQYLPFFQRNGRMQGLVEFVLSGQRLKVTIPKEGVTIVFAPSGIKTPSRAQPASGGKPAVQGEPYTEEALQFTREHAMQRDCEITVDTMDRGGTFLGTLTVLPAQPSGKPLNLPLALLRSGLATLQPSISPDRLPGGHELLAAQQAAKEARLKVWEKWTPEAEQEELEAEQGLAAAGPASAREVMEVVVTDVVDATEIYVQKLKEPRVAWLTEQLSAVAQADAPAVPPELKVGATCLAQYSLDQQWYRAYVERANAVAGQYDVFFLDYGNRERVSSKSVRTMDAALASVPPQAHMCALAYIKAPPAGTEHAAEARTLLSELLGDGQPMQATVVAKERQAPSKELARHPKWANGRRLVQLVEQASQADVAVELLCAGLARLPSQKARRSSAPPLPGQREAVAALAPYQEEARSGRLGIFAYGDPGDSEDEEQQAPKPAAWGKK